MKVAILCAVDIYANNGGVESYLKNYISHRKKQGDEVTFISTPGKVSGSLDLWWRTLSFAFTRHDLRGYDEVITNTHSFIPFIKSGNARVVSIWHGSGWQRFYDDIRAFASPYTYLDAFLEVLDSLFAPTIYPVSKHTLKFITTGMWKREGSDQVLYPLAGEGFKPMPHKKPNDGKRRILFVGNPKNKRKGFKRMVKALRHLPEDYQLVVCGGEKKGRTLDQPTLDHTPHFIEYMGMVDNDGMPEFYNLCDCYCLPTTYEGMPVTVMEALACKCPVVATKVGGIPEVIRDGENGYLTGTDPKDIADTIILANDLVVK